MFIVQAGVQTRLGINLALFLFHCSHQTCVSDLNTVTTPSKLLAPEVDLVRVHI